VGVNQTAQTLFSNINDEKMKDVNDLLEYLDKIEYCSKHVQPCYG
jgi:hypothetical protein